MRIIRYNGKVLYDPRIRRLQVSDAVCKLEANKAGSMSFRVPPSNPLYDTFEEMKPSAEVTLEDDGEEIFRGRITDIEKDDQGMQEITCEGHLGYLNDSLVRPYGTYADPDNWSTVISPTGSEVWQYLITQHNAQVDGSQSFNFGVVDFPEVNLEQGTSAYPTTASEIKEKILDKKLGYIRARMVDNIRYIDFLGEMPNGTNTQRIEFGSNLVEYTSSILIKDMVTAIVATASIPDESSEGGTRTASLSEVADGPYGLDYYIQGDKMVANIGVEKNGVIEQKKNYDADSIDHFCRQVAADLKDSYIPVESLELRAVDLHAIDPTISPFRLYDWVRVTAKPFNLDQWMMIVSIEVNVSDPARTRYVLGSTKPTLTDETTVSQMNLKLELGDGINAAEALSEEAKAAAIDARTAGEQALVEAKKKNRVFIQQPFPPYEKGDIWKRTYDGRTVMYVCVYDRLEGNFEMSDWDFSTTDDKKADEANAKVVKIISDVSTIGIETIVSQEGVVLVSDEATASQVEEAKAYAVANNVQVVRVTQGVLEAVKSEAESTVIVNASAVKSSFGEFNRIDAEAASIATLQVGLAKIANLEVEALTADSAIITDLQAAKAIVDDLDVNYAQIDLANVSNAWIEDGVIKDAAIGDAKIAGVSANKITAGTLDAGKINVVNLNARNLLVETINGQAVLGGSYSLVPSSSEGYSSKNPSNEGWYEIVQGVFVPSADTSVQSGKAYYTLGVTQVSTKQYVDEVADQLDQRIDGAIETFTGDVVPTLANYPASTWTSDADKDEHVGDIYYVINAASQADGYCYRFAKIHDNQTGTDSYNWVLIKDSDVTKALQELIDINGYLGDTDVIESHTDLASWLTNTDAELSSTKSSVSSIQTTLGTKVDTSTFNTLSQKVDTNESNITTLTTTVNGHTTTLSNHSTLISQNSSNIALRATKTEVLGGLSAYIPLEYLQSSGTQRINTGYIRNGYPFRIDADVMWATVPSGEADWAGDYNGSTTSGDVNNGFVFGVYNNGSTYIWGGNGWDLGTTPVASTKYSYSFAFPSLTSRRAVINGVEYGKYDVMNSAMPNTGAVAVGLFSGRGTAQYAAASVRIYKARIYNPDLVRDFIPVKRISDNVLGMYDRVNDVFYANAGTGDFIAGPETSWTEKISSVNSDISVQAGLIASRVERDGVISSINQSAESVTINAGKVNIEGAAIFTSGRLSQTNIDNLVDGAAKTATDYITKIDNNGITLHPSSGTANRTVVNASGQEIFKNNVSVAFFGDTSRIGPASGKHVQIDSDSFDIYDGATQLSTFESNKLVLGYGTGLTIQKLTLPSAGVYSGTQVTQLHSADFNINAYHGVVNVTSGMVDDALLVDGSPVITQARGTAKSAVYANALNVVSGDEIRFGPTKLSSAGNLYIGYKWSDGSTSPTITAYRMCNAAGSLTEVACSKISASTLNVRTVLYNNASGTTGTVSLSASAANYNHVRIHYRDNESRYASIDVYSPTGKYVSFMSYHLTGNGSWPIQLTLGIGYINGTSITRSGDKYVNFGSGASQGDQASIYIIRVEAWNE